MADLSGIEWLHDVFLDRQGASWNCWWGCERWSPACLNCYIFRQPPLRMRHLKFDKAAVGGKTPIVYAERRVLFQPLRWRDPRMIFVESLGDLWEGRVPIERTAEMFAIMLLARRHIFITSTKRTRRQRNWLRSPRFYRLVVEAFQAILAEYTGRLDDRDVEQAQRHLARSCLGGVLLPLPNVWVGTTVEDNERAAERIPLLRGTPAAVRWISCEPLTSEDEDPLNLDPWLAPQPPRWGPEYVEPTSPAGILVQDLEEVPGIDWAVFGGESGPAAKATDLDTEPAVGLRPINLNNLEALIGEANRAGARVFVKQLGEPWAKETGAASKKGSDPAEWPHEFQVRQYPVQLAQRALTIDPGNVAALADIQRGRSLTDAYA